MMETGIETHLQLTGVAATAEATMIEVILKGELGTAAEIDVDHVAETVTGGSEGLSC